MDLDYNGKDSLLIEAMRESDKGVVALVYLSNYTSSQLE